MKILTILVLGITFLLATIDINSANKEELMSLKGIGSKKADAIIFYRRGNCFKSVNALRDVKGIGPKFMEKNVKNLTAGMCKKK